MSCPLPLQTVGVFLKDRDLTDLLTDPMLADATCAIDDARGDKTKAEVANELARKTDATREVLRRYTSDRMPAADIQRVLDSISDNQAYLSFNVEPVQRALDILTASFNPKKPQVHYY